MPDDKSEKVNELKEKGNECIKNKDFTEAVLHYSQAIQLNPNVPQLYSNRSLALLKIMQFHHALQDAQVTVRLDPGWAKGYFRCGEVYFATQHYAEAMESYRRASQLQPDIHLIEYVVKANNEMRKQEKMDKQMPWVGAGIGLICGVLLVVADAVIPDNSMLGHPILQVLITIIFSLGGLGLGHCYRWYLHNQRTGLLEPPVDLLGGDSMSSEEANGLLNNSETMEEKKHHPRYNKAQARQRYKKGKS